MKLCTIGLGYIGLPTSIMFAKYIDSVVGVDINISTVESLNNGVIHLKEPGLQNSLNEVVEKGNFKASLTPEKADVFIIAVPTPNNSDEDKSCDLSYVNQAIRSILPYLEKGNIIIVESTIAPRSMDDTIKPLIENNGFIIGSDIYLVHCPERVLPGKIMHELIYNNRIVGGMTEVCTQKGAEVYSKFVQGEIIKTDARTAEMSKLMENTYRDINIALANELTRICDKLNIDTLEVIDMANKHPRVNIHNPGPGVGGHCLAVDPYFIISKAREESRLIRTSREINNEMPQYIIEKVFSLLDFDLSKKITLLGAAYKGNVDDTRESPSIEIFNKLKNHYKVNVSLYDPYVKDSNFIESDLRNAVKDSSIIVILTDHKDFESIKLESIIGMDEYKIFDTKNIVKEYPNESDFYNLGNVNKHKEVTNA